MGPGHQKISKLQLLQKRSENWLDVSFSDYFHHFEENAFGRVMKTVQPGPIQGGGSIPHAFSGRFHLRSGETDAFDGVHHDDTLGYSAKARDLPRTSYL